MASPNSLNDQHSEIDTIFIEELLSRLEALARDNEELEELSEDAEQSTDAAASTTTSESESEEDPEIAALTTHHQQEGQHDSHFAEGQSPAKSDTTHSSRTTSPNGLSPFNVDTIDPEEVEAAYRDQRP